MDERRGLKKIIIRNFKKKKNTYIFFLKPTQPKTKFKYTFFFFKEKTKQILHREVFWLLCSPPSVFFFFFGKKERKKDEREGKEGILCKAKEYKCSRTFVHKMWRKKRGRGEEEEEESFFSPTTHHHHHLIFSAHEGTGLGRVKRATKKEGKEKNKWGKGKKRERERERAGKNFPPLFSLSFFFLPQNCSLPPHLFRGTSPTRPSLKKRVLAPWSFFFFCWVVLFFVFFYLYEFFFSFLLEEKEKRKKKQKGKKNKWKKNPAKGKRGKREKRASMSEMRKLLISRVLGKKFLWKKGDSWFF